jgi:hypothetical protein
VELGADVRSSDDRVTASGTVFRSTHDALYVTGTIAGVAGFSSRYIPDAAALRTYGVEVSLAVRLVASTRLRWDSRVNVTSTATEVTRPATEASSLPLPFTRHGFRSHVLIGGGRATAIAPFTGRANGNGAPRFDLSAINALSSGPLAVSVQVDWRAGGQVYSALLARRDLSRTSSDYSDPSPGSPTELGAYRRERATFTDTLGVYLTPGGSLRIRELNVRYALSPRWAERVLRTRSVGVSLQMRNLAMWTRSIAADPEFSGLGTSSVARYVDIGSYPPMRQLFVGIDAGF